MKVLPIPFPLSEISGISQFTIPPTPIHGENLFGSLIKNAPVAPVSLLTGERHD